LFLRNWGKPEDYRYAGWRKQWSIHWWWRSFFQVYVLQGVLQFLVVLPVLVVFRSESVSVGAYGIFWAGVAGLGLVIETLADIQKAIFKRSPENHQRILMQGLWAYSRHPNYFGEAMFWWGIGMMAVAVPWGILTLVSPILMNWLLLKVSGVPLLEARWKERPEFVQYESQTNRFVPGRKRCHG
jgi:steroid 5-alpha reductase family enzyme